MDFGDRLKQLRENLMISKRQFAKISGVALSYLHEIERGDKSPTLATMEKLASALGVTLAEFFTEELSPVPPDLRQLLWEAQGLSLEKRRILIELVRSMKGD